jgi:PAS domain S-box-containing protein
MTSKTIRSGEKREQVHPAVETRHDPTVIADALPSVLRIAKDLIPADGFAVWRKSPDNTTWKIVAHYGVSEEFASLSSSGSEGMPDEPVIAEDVSRLPMLSARARAHAVENIRSLLAVPLSLRDGRTGTITFYFRTPHKFTRDEIDRATALAQITSSAITSSELYRDESRAKERSDFLADASSVLSSSLNVEDTLRAVANMAVPRVADWCAIDLLDSSGELKRLIVTHSDPAKTKLGYEIHAEFPPSTAPETGLGNILRTGIGQLIPEMSDEMLIAGSRSEEHLASLRALGLRSLMLVPLVLRGNSIGLITFVAAESNRRFEEADLTLAVTLANRSAVAIENAKLFQQLQARELEARTLLQNIPDVVSRFDRDLRYLYISPQAERLMGIPPSEYTGKTFAEMGLPPQLVEYFTKAVRGIFDTGQPATIEFARETAIGTRYFVGTGVPELTRDGRVESVLTLTRDVTEQRTAQDALRRSEANLRVITDTIPSLVSYIDTEERFVRVNRTFEQWFQKPLGAIVGHTIEETLGTDNYQRVRDKIKRVLKGEPVQFEARNVYADRPRHVLITYSPDMSEDGNVRGFVSLVTDITDRRLAEDALRRSEKLATAGRLAASIAHEINNPLEAITNLLFLIKNEPAGSEQLQTFIDMADHELRRVSHITRQTLGFYRDSVGPTRFDIRAVVEDVLTLLGRRSSVKQIELRRKMELPGNLIAPQGEVRQIVANLLTNAIDATEVGRVIIKISMSHQRQTGLNAITLTIADTGQGISKSNQQRLFEPFFTTKKDIGTGLGLWVTRQLVEKNGGTIRVRSREGAGTVFRVTLPEIPPTIG